MPCWRASTIPRSRASVPLRQARAISPQRTTSPSSAREVGTACGGAGHALPVDLPWDLRARSSSDKIQLGLIPAARQLWYLQNWQFFRVTRVTSHSPLPWVHLKLSLYPLCTERRKKARQEGQT
jgi:hypothetical protein